MNFELKKIYNNDHLEFYISETKTSIKLPYYEGGISAGFPSPAEDFMDSKIDLNNLLVDNPASTYYVRVFGDSMKGAGIISGDLLVVDRSLEISNKCIVVAHIDGEFTVKRIKKSKTKMFLKAENKNYKDIEINEEMDFHLFGVVTHAIHHLL